MLNTARNRFENFFEYQKEMARVAVLPFFKNQRLDLNKRLVADVGCGEGGIVAALAREYPAGNFVGFDAVKKHVIKARGRNIAKSNFEVYDILTEPTSRDFDVIICRDVLEYAVDLKSALENLQTMCKPGGKIFVAFPPYYSPFGGHQHTLRGSYARFLPFIHLLPDIFFNRILENQRPDREGKESFIEGYLSDFRRVRKTKISITKFKKFCQELGLVIEAEEVYFIRPSIAMRYSLPIIKNRLFGRIPFFREFSSSGALYLLQK